MYKDFIMVGTDEAMSVIGGTEMEDAARALGRLIGLLVGTIEKLLDKKGEPQTSAAF